jgi:hypothetical protein
MIKILFFLSLVSSASSKTFRYRSGAPDGDSHFFEEKTVSVPVARNQCNALEQCVSFSFPSPTRFPEGEVNVFFFEHADWHVKPTGEPSFVEDPNWHTYVNTTRELKLIKPEINQVLSQSQIPSKLRGTDSLDRNMRFLQSLFDIVATKAHGPIASSIIAPYAVATSSDASKPEVERVMAMKLIIFLGDSSETGKILISHGVYQAMKKIISERDSWDELTVTALDAIANICFFRSANAELRKLGAVSFLKNLISEPGFPGLQAAMALMHLEDMELSLPKEMIEELIRVLESAIDGDPAHGIMWDLVPGPLSAIKYLVRHGNPEGLLDAGLMEQLLRVLESENSDELIATLEIMMALSRSSERARDMILLADHSIRDMRERLRSFQTAVDLASDLSSLVSILDSPRFEL